VSWHPEHRIAVLSMWRGSECVSTFRLRQADVPAFVFALTRGLADIAAASVPSAYRDDATAHLVGQASAASRPAQPHRTPTEVAARGLTAIIGGCTRLRDWLGRR
jgi:hypothetical protein